MFKAIHKVFYRLSWLMAITGGAVLLALVLMVCLSILGRTATSILHSNWMQGTLPDMANWLIATGIGPVYGDYELLVGGLAFSIFAFLSWCQMTNGHATVDVFTSGMSDRKLRILQMFIETAFAATLVLIAYQLNIGMDTLMRRGSTTFLLQYPLWWNYAFALVPAVFTAVIGVYMALVRIAEALLDRPLVDSQGASL